jgi:hypothetical protein
MGVALVELSMAEEIGCACGYDNILDVVHWVRLEFYRWSTDAFV